MTNPIQAFAQFMSNPRQMIIERTGVDLPQDVTTPENILQHLLNTGQVTQAQVNNAYAACSDPAVKQMFGLK